MLDLGLVTTLLIGGTAGLIAFWLCRHPTLASASKRPVRPKPLWIDYAFYGLLIAFAVLYSVLEIRKFETFSFWGIDQALFDQIVWNSLHGRPYENSVIAGLPIVLGQHFSVLLVALAPLYALHSDPRTLVIVPVLCVALAALPLYWFARKQLDAPLAFVIGLVFLLSPGVQFMALGQFYEIMLAIPLLMLAGSFLLSRRYTPFLVVLVLAFLVKEVVPLVGLGMGGYLVLVQRQYKLGAAVSLLSLASFAALLQWIIPFFEGSSNYFFFTAMGYGTGQFSHLGNDFPEILETVLARPNVIFERAPVALKADAAIKLVVPFGLFPVLGLDVAALALPTLAVILMSNSEIDSLLSSHHYATALPFMALATVAGVRRILAWADARTHSLQARRGIRAAMGVFLLSTSLCNYYLFAPGPLSRDSDGNRYTPSAHDRLGFELAATIPPQAAVIVQPELAQLISQREHLFVMHGAPCWGAADYLFADSTRPWFEYTRPGWNEALSLNYFETVTNQEGYQIKKQQVETPPAHLLDIPFENGVALWGYTLPMTGTVRGGVPLNLHTAWRAERDIGGRYTVQTYLLDAQGRAWVEEEREPCRGYLSTAGWNAGRVVNNNQIISLPPTMPAGDYRLLLAVREHLSGQAIRTGDGRPAVLLASLSIEKNKQSYAANDLMIENRWYVDMREMRLLGFKSLPESIGVNETLAVGLYWRARSKPKGDYLIAVALSDALGNTRVQQQSRPAQNTYPTAAWDAGEVLLDWHDLDIPDGLAPGEYHVRVVLQDSQAAQVLGETAIGKILIKTR